MKVVRFFMTMTVEEMRILQLRMTKPEFTNDQIAQLLGVNRKRVYEFFQRETMRIPELARLLYRHKSKRTK